MQYKLYDYVMADQEGRPIHPDRQFNPFEKSREAMNLASMLITGAKRTLS